MNEVEIPGVRDITKAFHWLADGDEVVLRELTDAFLPFVLSMWERFVRILLQELLMSNHTILRILGCPSRRERVSLLCWNHFARRKRGHIF